MLVESFSGIRGIWRKDLNEDIARRYAYCFKEVLGLKKVVIGHDTRQSSMYIKKAMLSVFDEIIDIGISPTPMTENSVREFKADGGIMITASHNEPEWNGFKFLGKDGAVLRPVAIKRVIDKFHELKGMDETDFFEKFMYKESSANAHKVLKMHNDALHRYAKFVRRSVKDIVKDARILLDPNGGSGIVYKEVLDILGVKAVTINSEPGKFIRKIEPNSESLAYLKERAIGYDIVAGFDCDADRVELVTNEGIVSGQYLLAMAVEVILSEIKKAEKQVVVTNDATSGVVREIASKYGARLEEVEVGEINVVDGMEHYKSIIGGEGSSSGVILWPSRCRDGLIMLLLILKLIHKNKKSVKEIIAGMPKYYTVRENIRFDGNIKERFKELYLKKGYKIQINGDGIKAIYDESYVWCRPSKTEGNVYRVISDSKDESKAKVMLRETKGIFE